MGRYLGSYAIDDILYLTKQVSAVTTGAATDGDSVPTWRVYEDNTTTPVTTGSFTTFNSQTGFYVTPITLASAIGYEVGKCYSIRSAVTVASVIGADVDSFQIGAPGRLIPGAITANAYTAGALQAMTLGSVLGAVTVGSTSVTAVQTAVTAGSIGAVTVGATSVSAIQAAVTANSIGAVTLGATSVSAIQAAVTANSIGAVTVGATAQAAIAALVTMSSTSRAQLVDDIWDEPKAGHTTADTYGEFLDATVSGISGGAGDTTVSPTAASAIAAAVWNATKASFVDAGTFGELLDATVSGIVAGDSTLGSTSVAAIATAVQAAVTAGSIGPVTVGSTSVTAIQTAVTAGSIGAVTVGATAVAAIQSGLASQTSVDAIDDFIDTEISAIKAKTDQLTFGVANVLNANITHVNETSITGNGQTGTEFGPGT